MSNQVVLTCQYCKEPYSVFDGLEKRCNFVPGCKECEGSIKAFKEAHVNVEFYFEKDSEVDVFAVFPDLKICYSSLGQHGEYSENYLKECKKANLHQAKRLIKELEDIGYYLNIIY